MKNILYSIVLLFCLVVSVVAQDVPRVISYQGVLVDESGKPEDGSVDILFGLQNLEGAEHIDWIEERKGIQIRGGIFHVFLGDSSVPAGFPVLRGNYALSIKVNGKIPPYFVPLSSVPYALHALVADSLINVIDSVKASFKAEMAKFADSSRVSYISDTTKMRIPSGVPIGTIVAFGGENIPDGWLLCDGREFNVAQNQEYKSLFDAIGIAWGGNLSLQIFRIPDLRGYFLRGATPKSANDEDQLQRDPDRTTRVGGSSNWKIGSMQPDAFQGHKHNIATYDNVERPMLGISNSQNSNGWYSINPTNNPTSGGLSVENPRSDNQNGEPRTSSETRPKNVYVNYIIKAK